MLESVKHRWCIWPIKAASHELAAKMFDYSPLEGT
jgi:hypothetical protein